MNKKEEFERQEGKDPQGLDMEGKENEVKSLKLWEVIIMLETWRKGLDGNQRKVAEGICAGNIGGKGEQKRKGERRDINGDKERDGRKGKGVEIVREGIVVGRVKIRKQRWRIMGVYVNGNMGETQELEGWMEKKEKRVLILIGEERERKRYGNGGTKRWR